MLIVEKRRFKTEQIGSTAAVKLEECKMNSEKENVRCPKNKIK